MKNRLSLFLLFCAVGSATAIYASSERRILTNAIMPTFIGGQPHVTGTVTRQELSTSELAAQQPVHFVLKMRNFDELQARIQKGDIISLGEMDSRYFPTHETWTAVAAWARAQGFTVEDEAPSRMTVFASSSVARVGAMLQMKFARVVGTDGREYTSAITPPALPAEFGDSVLTVLKLQPHLRLIRSQTITPIQSNGKDYISPVTVAQLYNASGHGVDGTGQTIVVLGGAQIQTNDLTTFWTAARLPTTAAQFTEIDPSPQELESNSFAAEPTMDVEWASAMAPGAKIIYFSSVDPELLASWLFTWQTTDQSIHQVNMSFSLSEACSANAGALPAYSQYFAAMTATGVTFFASSGDNGSNADVTSNQELGTGFSPNGPLAPNYPASDPMVTAVGGTIMCFATDVTGGPALPVTEGGWCLPNNQPLSADSGDDASAGGVSLFFSRPPWQTGAGMPSGVKRCVPDVAALAFGNFAPMYNFSGEILGAGGTSLSSPIWAGFCALINQARANAGLQPVGLLGPRIYPLNGTSVFSQMTTGSATGADGFSTMATNGAYTLGPNYNLVTGLGTPDVGSLIAALIVPETGTAPVITGQPKAMSVPVGGTATFTVAAGGIPAPSYQWLVNGTAISDGPQSEVTTFSGVATTLTCTVSGATTNTLTISGAEYGMQVAAIAVNPDGIATSNTTNLTIIRAVPVITWNTPAAITYGTALTSEQLNATANVPGSFVYTPAAGTVLNAGTNTLSVTFTPDVPMDYTGATATQSVVVNQAVPTITWATPAAIGEGTALSSLQLDATASVPGTFDYSPAAGAVLNLGIQSLNVVFTPTDSTDYANVAATRTLLVDPAPPEADPAGAVTATAFVAVWSPVAGATGYRLDISTNSSFTSFVAGYENIDVGDVTSVKVGGLNPATTYYYRVRAYDNTGSSISSVTIKTTTTSTINIATPLTVSTLAGQALTSGSADGIGGSARFNYPSGVVAADNAVNIFVADTDNNTIRKIAVATGTVSTLAGLAGASGNADGTGTAARFDKPSGVALDVAGNVYVADTLNNTIRVVTPSGVVTTLAGSPGRIGSEDGIGAGAQFNGPQGIATDNSGHLYVADTNNNTIRKVLLSTGTVSTIAGTAGAAGNADGSGTASQFNYPSGVAVDGAGDVYVADTDNDTIRAITPQGLVRTLAGLAGSSGGADGIGSGATFDSPSALTVDASGTIYVADTGNFTIRKVIPATRAVNTLAGLAGTSGSADGVGSAALFFQPTGVSADNSGNLYIADTDNQTIRLGLLEMAPTIQEQPQSQKVDVFSAATFSVTASGRPAPNYQWYFDGAVINGATGSSYSLASVQTTNAGTYTVTVTNAMGSVTSTPATLTINPSQPGLTSNSISKGGGGGGVPSLWFVCALALVGIARAISFGGYSARKR